MGIARLALFDGVDGKMVLNASDSVIDYWFTVGLNGVLSGTVKIESGVNVDSILETAEENSHFVKVGLEDRLYGGVIESCRKDDTVWSVSFIGADGWWGKMDSVSSTMAGGGFSGEDSNEGIKIFYADSARGVLFEVFKNQAEVIDARGWDSTVLDFSQLGRGSSIVGQEWSRSYRLNSFETPVFSSVVNSVVEQLDDGEFFRVKVSEPLESDFRFIVSVGSGGKHYYMDEQWADIFDVEFDYSGVERRPIGVAAGSDLSGRKQLAITTQGLQINDHVFSSAIASSSSEASNAISNLAYSEKARVNASNGSLSFSMFAEGGDVGDVLDQITVIVGFDDGVEFTGTVVEKRVEGNIITYVLDLVSEPSSSSVRSAPSVERNLIFDPLNKASSLSFKNARKASNGTGWRN